MTVPETLAVKLRLEAAQIVEFTEAVGEREIQSVSLAKNASFTPPV